MRNLMIPVIAVVIGFAAASSALESQGRGGAPGGAAGQRPPALLQNYVDFSVTAPPATLELDPFYKKYTDAHGIPVVTSEKVPDAALLMARDIVKFMLADRPDLRRELIRKKWKLAIMAETEVTYDIPEHRKFRPLPKIDDERLTPQQRETYNQPGGVGSMTGEQYLELTRARIRRRAERREHDVVRGGEPARLPGHALLRKFDLRARVLARHHARRGVHGRSRLPQGRGRRLRVGEETEPDIGAGLSGQQLQRGPGQRASRRTSSAVAAIATR